MKEIHKKVSVSFYCFEKQSVDFKVRLRYDNLNQGEFLTSLLELYLIQDPDVLKVVEKIKLNLKKTSKTKSKTTISDYKKGEKMLKDLGISDTDREHIYDAIEEAEMYEDE